MDVFKTFKNKQINIKGTCEEPLFRASDVCNVLGTYDGINSEFLTEKEMYKILFKENAKEFVDWTYNVLVDIRSNDKNRLKNSKENIILTHFSKKSIIYVGFTETNVIKCGYTDDPEARLKFHKKEIHSNFTFEYVYESLHNRKIERLMYQHPEFKKRRFSKAYSGRDRVQTELFKLDKVFDIYAVDRIIKEIKDRVESEELNKDKDVEISRLRLKVMDLENTLSISSDCGPKWTKYYYVE
jgi:hypothetical protein